MTFMMRQTMGAKMLLGSSRRSFSSAVSTNQLTDNWLRSLQVTSTTGESKEAVGQLQSILDYYNKGNAASLKAIDWEGHKERIHTTGVVDNVHAKYTNFMKTSYTIDSAVSRCGHATE